MIVAFCKRRPDFRRGRNEGEGSGPCRHWRSGMLLAQQFLGVDKAELVRCSNSY